MDGMIVSDEPGVYKEGSHGIRIENILEVQKDLENSDGQFLKFGMLTYAPIDLEAIDPKYMQQEDIDHLNAYHQAVYDKVEQDFLWIRVNGSLVGGCIGLLLFLGTQMFR